jgi:hypothetical protein
MQRAQPSTVRSPVFDWILSGAFLLLLWLPTLDKIFRLDHAPDPQENRVLAHRPGFGELRVGHLREFLAASETWFNDHFGFRNRLIAWFQSSQPVLYHADDLYRVPVLTGPHHWHFSARLQMIENHLGWLTFSQQEMEAWQKLLEKRRDWLAQQGIQYVFVIAPDKETIYEDELPRWLQDAPKERQTKLAQFLQFMKVHSTVRILDLREPLVTARKTAPTYLQQDTHWNSFGGFVACQELIKSLSALSDLPPLQLNDFIWTNVPATGGDLARNEKEENYFEFHSKLQLPTVTGDITNIPSVWGSFRKCWITENSAPRTRTAIIFHDSFGLAWRNLLGCEFKQVIFLPDRREFNPAVIAANKPDVVINEMLECYFNTLDPNELMAKDGLP